MSASLSFATWMILASPAEAATVKPSLWTASSSSPAEEGATFDVTNLSDSKKLTTWIEGAPGEGVGSWATAAFNAERTVSGFTIWAGSWKSLDSWSHYNRPKQLTVEFSDGSTQEFTLTDEYKPQTLTFPSPKKTTSVKVTIRGVYQGSAFNDTAISEVTFNDASPPPGAPTTAITASSTSPADADQNYEAPSVADGLLDSMWCAGNRTGDGTNEWIEFTFAASTTVSKVELRNGIGSSLSDFNAGNRGAAATLTFSDGTTALINLKDIPRNQVISFPPRNTSKVRLTFNTIKQGTASTPVCLTETYFLP